MLWLVFAPDDVPAGKLAPREAVPQEKIERVLVRPPRAAPIPAEPAPPPPPEKKPEPVVPDKNAATLRIQLDGLSPGIAPADAFVSVVARRDARKSKGDDDPEFAADPRTLAAKGGSGREFDLNVSSLFDAGEKSRELSVTVDRAGYLPARVSERAAFRGVTDVRVRLTPAGAAVGIVRNDRFHPVADAEVSAFVRRGSQWELVDSALSAEDGGYRVRLVPGDANLVVAADGVHLPVHTQLTGVAGAESPLDPFTLYPGLAISGTVQFDIAGDAPAMLVAASPADAKAVMTSPTRRFGFDGPDLVECPAVSVLDRGAFRIQGLRPGTFDVHLAGHGLSAGIIVKSRRNVKAPYDGLEIVLDGTRVVVTVTADGRPVAGANVALRFGKDAVSVASDARGVVHCLCSPDRNYELLVGAHGFEPHRSRVDAPRAGGEMRVPVELTPAKR